MANEQADARLIAWDVLQAVEGGAHADAELARRLQSSSLDERDRGLATQLVYGTIAWQGLADHILTTLDRPPEKIELPLRTLLRMALFQMAKLDRIPDFAVVDTSVELSKRYKSGRAAGLVNALLRGFLRGEKRFDPPGDGDPAARLAVSGSHPRWLVERWIEILGPEQAEHLLEADNLPAPTVLRANLRRGDRDTAIAALARDGCSARPTKYSPEGIECDLRSGLTDLAAFRDGLATAQGEASQLVGRLIPVDAATILDACAAPGGKTTHLAERTGRRIVAVDRSRAGARQVARQAARLGVAVDSIRADARALPLSPSKAFDAVLVDAPCSGLGTLRQHPEIRWRRQPTDVRRLAHVQSAILDEVAVYVALGGTLVYATCTLLPDENEDRIALFLDSHPDFEVTDPRPDLPEAARDLIDKDHFLRTWPHRHNLDGFFAAKLGRKR